MLATNSFASVVQLIMGFLPVEFPLGEAGDVPTRAVKPGDDAAGDGFTHIQKDDRNRPRFPKPPSPAKTGSE